MEKTNQTSEFVSHEPCPQCGSKDNLARYTDGHGWCFGCGYYDGVPNLTEVRGMEFVKGECIPLNKRNINQDTVDHWGYQVGDYKGKKVQIANYRNDQGTIVAQKIRFPNKDFLFIGDSKSSGLYGKHLWRDGGKMVVITEGELDALSVSQVQGNKWPVVSVPTGSAGARKAIAQDLEWLEQFDSVIFMFDQDEAGRKALDECVPLFTPGKAKIAKLPLKDANACLVEGRHSEIIDAIWGAKVFRPDGIVDGRDLWDLISNEDTRESSDYPYTGLNDVTKGIRRGEIVTITAGSGIGKSLICREVAYHLLLQDKKVGYIALEESNKRSALGFVGFLVLSSGFKSCLSGQFLFFLFCLP